VPAAGQKILHMLNNGRFKHHYYLYHAEINPETMILFSTTRMFCLTISRTNKADLQFSWSSSSMLSRLDYCLVLCFYYHYVTLSIYFWSFSIC
jgi:hypothetical protein